MLFEHSPFSFLIIRSRQTNRIEKEGLMLTFFDSSLYLVKWEEPNKPILLSIKTPIHRDGSFGDSSRSLASFFNALGAGATCFILLTTHSQRFESRWSARQVTHS